MTENMSPIPINVLLIAPSAPPKNSPEAMQVGRYIDAADPSIHITLVTTPISIGWQRADHSLPLQRKNLRVITASLPNHRWTQRIVSNHRFSSWQVPDADFWLQWLDRKVLKQLSIKPDIIYSRSTPFSSALLAQRLKRTLGIPWMMHLSDPWTANPYRRLAGRHKEHDEIQEASCFESADLISLTTEGQAAHYRDKFPMKSRQIVVVPNMMPMSAPKLIHKPQKGPTDSVNITYTGALYGERQPTPLLEALHELNTSNPSICSQIEVHFYGNMASSTAIDIDSAPGCKQHGPVTFAEAGIAQENADVLLTIEPDGDDPMLKHFLPSKNLDYMAQGRPILAITPASSETHRLCSKGYGWAVSPNDALALKNRLITLVNLRRQGVSLFEPPPMGQSSYSAEAVSLETTQYLRSLVVNRSAQE